MIHRHMGKTSAKCWFLHIIWKLTIFKISFFLPASPWCSPPTFTKTAMSICHPPRAPLVEWRFLKVHEKQSHLRKMSIQKTPDGCYLVWCVSMCCFEIWKGNIFIEDVVLVELPQMVCYFLRGSCVLHNKFSHHSLVCWNMAGSSMLFPSIFMFCA